MSKTSIFGVVSGSIAVDTALSATSSNPVQNQIIKAALDEKADSASLSAVATSGSYNDLSDKPTITSSVTVDSALSESSENPVQNKIIDAALAAKQDALTAGDNITIVDNTISATSSGVAATVLAAAYDATATYKYGDHVTYNNLLYYCNQPGGITTAEEWDSTHWTNINLTDAFLPFIKTSTWSDSGAYGGIPVWNGTHWVLSSDDRGINHKFNIYLGNETDIRDGNSICVEVAGSTNKLSGGCTQLAIFGSCQNYADHCIAIGQAATVNAYNAIALGYYAQAKGGCSLALGTAFASGYHSISIDAGYYSSVYEAPSSFNTQANRINISGENGTFLTTSHASGPCLTTQGINPTNIGVLDVMNGTSAIKDKLIVCRNNDTTTTNDVTTITGTEVFSILKNGALQSGYTADTSSTTVSLAAVAGQTYRYSGAVTSLTISTFDGATTLATSNGVNPTNIIVTAGANMSLVLTALTASFDYIIPSGLTFTTGTITGFTEGSKYLITIQNNIVKVEALTTYTPA